MSTQNNQVPVSLYGQLVYNLLNLIIIFTVYLADEACKNYLLPPWSSQMSK